MSKFFLIACFLVATTFAKNPKMWEHQHSFILKKNQIANIHVDEINIKSKQKNSSYLLRFNWVLFENGNLVMLLNYMGHHHQYILREEKPLNSVKIKLLNDSWNFDSKVYALINFFNFNKNRQTASINVYIKDRKKRVLTKFKDKE